MICELAAAFGAVGGATSPQAGLSRTNVEQLIRAREILTVSSRQRHDVHQIASQVGLNANKLCAGFKLMFGMTLVDYRREVSLLEARRLLDTTQLSVQKIADRIGYGHQSTFATAFKNRFGISPTLYRHKLTLPPGIRSSGAVARGAPKTPRPDPKRQGQYCARSRVASRGCESRSNAAMPWSCS